MISTVIKTTLILRKLKYEASALFLPSNNRRNRAQHVTAIFWQRNVKQQRVESHIVVKLIRDIPTVLRPRNYFCATFREDPEYECFPKLSRCALFSFRRVREKKKEATARSCFSHPSPSLDHPPGRRWRHRCVECFYSITPAARRYPLNHLLNPRSSALSTPSFGLDGLRKLKYYPSFDPDPVEHGDARVSPRISRILAISAIPLSKTYSLANVLNLIPTDVDDVDVNVSIGHRDSHSITCRECRYTVLVTTWRHTVTPCQLLLNPLLSRRSWSRAVSSW